MALCISETILYVGDGRPVCSSIFTPGAHVRTNLTVATLLGHRDHTTELGALRISVCVCPSRACAKLSPAHSVRDIHRRAESPWGQAT
jgi:hypothetical protein